MNINNRLKTIAGYIQKGAAVADVGTDHGKLPAYLAKNELADPIIASDISAGSLAAARRTAEKYKVTDKITFITAPGLTALDGTEVDAIVIAGVGGETITEILGGALWTKKQSIKLILQPQTKIATLCQWLRENGYMIHDATLSRDRGRIYIIMLAGGGVSDSVLEPYTELLTILKNKQDPLYAEYTEILSLSNGKQT